MQDGSQPTKQFFLCGTCAREVEPQTSSEFEALELRRADHMDGTTTWTCPRCGEVVYVMVDYGELEFGVGAEPKADDRTFESFVSLVSKVNET